MANSKVATNKVVHPLKNNISGLALLSSKKVSIGIINPKINKEIDLSLFETFLFNAPTDLSNLRKINSIMKANNTKFRSNTISEVIK